MSVTEEKFGGTGNGSYVIGDLLQATNTDVLTRLPSVEVGNVLLSGGVATASSWGKVTSSHVDASIYNTSNPQVNITGNAATVTTNANLTGPITSAGNATSIASQTGTGTTFVMNTSPTLVTPILGEASATSLACPTFTTSSGAMTFTPASGSGFNIALAATGDFVINTNHFYVDTSTGNVGMGMSSPGARLQVESAAADVGMIIRHTAGSNNPGLYIYTNESTRHVSMLATGSLVSGQLLRLGAEGADGVVNIASDGVGLINITDPLAALHLPASTTSKASLCIPAGDAPSSPIAGLMWNDSTRKSLTAYIGSMTQFDRRVIFTNTAAKTIEATTTETTVFGTGVGTLTLAANSLSPGKLVEIVIRGYLLTNTSGTNTLQIRGKIGGTTRIDTGVITMPNSIGQSPVYEGTFEIRAFVHTTAIGASGSVRVWGEFRFHQLSGTSFSYAMNESNNPTVTVDTTASQVLDVTAQWGTSSGFNIFQSNSQQVSFAA